MYDNYGFQYLPRELVNRYDEIYRSILSEVVHNLVQHDLGHFRSYLSCLDYATWIYWLESANPATLEQLEVAAKYGSDIAETIRDEVHDAFENSDGECDEEQELDYAVGNSVLLVMPTTNEFNEFERCVWDDIQDSNVIEPYFNGDLLVSIRPGLSRLLLTSNSGMYVT
ncbi:hypothetical protein pVa21_146 [Vibrio phage pVa-21]|nr:hypothetical protein pVa21_146 [Vibrio phage pVa-21]